MKAVTRSEHKSWSTFPYTSVKEFLFFVDVSVSLFVF